MNATKFSLFELLLLMTCVALACCFAVRGLPLLGACFVLTVISFRTAVVDFTSLGCLANLLTVVFGTLTIGLMIVWAVTWG